MNGSVLICDGTIGNVPICVLYSGHELVLEVSLDGMEPSRVSLVLCSPHEMVLLVSLYALSLYAMERCQPYWVTSEVLFIKNGGHIDIVE